MSSSRGLNLSPPEGGGQLRSPGPTLDGMAERLSIGWRDAWLPAALAIVGALELASLQIPRWAIGIAIEVAACLLLVGRRRYPLVAPILAGLTVLLIAFVGPGLDGPSLPIPILLLAIFALARWNVDLRGLFGLAAIVLVAYIDILFVDVQDEGWPDLVFVAALTVPPYVLGRLIRRLADQAELLRRNQALVRREAARVERDRIARELHDVIAHSVSAMVVQTAVAQDLLRSDIDRAEAALADVAATGRQALAETGRLLHVIRDQDDELGLQPAPGLADVPRLVESFRDRGLRVECDLPDPMPTLPGGVDVSTYRIVQEALTNAQRYAADQRVKLRVTTTDDTVTIRTSNRADEPTSAASGNGFGSRLGLAGMAERAAVLGGSLRHWQRDGRFEVEATLPKSGQ
jgi:signal transduction histidine kinase